MVKPASHYTRATTFAITVLSLVLAGSLAAGMLYWLLHSAGQSSGDRQQYLLRMASLATAALLLLLLVLLGVVAHYVARRISTPSETYRPMGYEDAWAEAGRRLKAKDAPPIEGFENPSADDHGKK